MSQYAEGHRKAMKDKAHRLAHGDPHQKVDASSWTPGEPEDGNVQTGERPVSPRQFKKGGQVEGKQARRRADRLPRKSGGKAITADSYINRDVKEANEDREGPKHVGGMKRGGKAHDDEQEDKALIRKEVKPGALRQERKSGGLSVSNGALEGERPEKGGRLAHAKGGHVGYHIVGDKDGYVYGRKKTMAGAERAMQGVRDRGYSDRPDFHIRPITNEADYGLNQHEPRAARKSGGRAKSGKTDINIVIAAGPRGEQAPPSPEMGAAAPPPMPMPMPKPAGAPPMAPPPGAMGAGPPQLPPMARKRGGKVHMEAGAGSGEGRLEKIREYGHKA